MSDLDALTRRIGEALADGPPLSRSIRLELKGQGVIRIAGREATNDEAPADLTVAVSRADLEALGRRTLDPAMAVMTGRLRVSDMATAMQMQGEIQALFRSLG